jgi:c-di-GMP-binding flagellar brake protein YcgR
MPRSTTVPQATAMSRNPHKDKRESPRYPTQWKVAVVFDEDEQRPTFHGVTNEISLGGLSLLTDHNIFAENPVTLLLAIPPLHNGARQKIVEIRARMVYTVHSAGHDRFRIGLHFIQFKGDGLRLLDSNLKDRSIGKPDGH